MCNGIWIKFSALQVNESLLSLLLIDCNQSVKQMQVCLLSPAPRAVPAFFSLGELRAHHGLSGQPEKPQTCGLSRAFLLALPGEPEYPRAIRGTVQTLRKSCVWHHKITTAGSVTNRKGRPAKGGLFLISVEPAQKVGSVH